MMNILFNLPDPEEEQTLKEKLVELSGVNKKYISFLKVSISEEEYVHVTMIDNFTIENKPDIVLLHGLTGTSFCFFTMFKELSNYFRVFAFDLPGQGLSSRIPYDFLDRDKAEAYFLERFKITFDELKIKNMILVGHSFGGYLAGLFFIKYPEMIDQIIFLSPIGLCSTFKEMPVSNAIENFIQTLAFKVKRGPNVGIKLLGVFSRPFFNKYCERSKFRGLNDYEYETFKSFLFSQVKKEYSSDPALYALFDKNLKAFKPLSLYIDKFKSHKILILYGDSDWCPSINGEEFKNLIGSDYVEIKTVKDSGHMIQTDNYSDLNSKLLDFLEGQKFIFRDAQPVKTADSESNE